MTASLTASFILKLEDQLSTGLQALSKKLEALSKLSKQVQLSGLDRAESLLGKVGSAADGAANKVGRIGANARSALGDLKRLSQQVISVNGAGTAFLPPSMARAAMTATILAAAAASAGGGRGGLPPPSVPFMSPSPMAPLLLGAPGGIPIPGFNAATRASLNYGGAFQAIAGGAATARRQMGLLAGQMQAVNHHMRELGEGALVAAGTGFGLMEPIKQYAEFENVLRHVAITEGLSGNAVEARIKELTKNIDQVAREAGQSGVELAHAYTFLVTTPLKKIPGLIDQLVPIMAHAATAYNVPINQMGQALYALSDSLKISAKDMPGALAAMAYAAKEAHFGVADFSRDLPEIAGRMSMLGWTGRGAANSVFAGLETVVQNASIPSQAATDYKDALIYITQPIARREFKRQGIDLEAELTAGTKSGKNPMDAFLDILQKLIKGINDPVQQAFKLGEVLHNQGAGTAFLSLLQHREEYEAMNRKLSGVTAQTMTDDDATAQRAPEVKLRKLNENIAQLVRTFGEGFSPMLDKLNGVLDKTIGLLDRLENAAPGSVTGVLTRVAAFLALTAALGLVIPLVKLAWSGLAVFWTLLKYTTIAISFLGRVTAALLIPALESLMGVMASVGAVFGISGGAVLAIVVLIALAAYLIYEHWDDIVAWFRRLWDQVKGAFRDFVSWVKEWTTGAATGAIEGIKSAWSELTGFFQRLIGDWTKPFDEFVANIGKKIEQMKRAVGLAPPAPGEGNPRAPNPDGSVPGLPYPGVVIPGAFHPGRSDGAPLAMTVAIQVDQDGRVTRAVPRSDSPGLRVDPGPDRGNVAVRA